MPDDRMFRSILAGRSRRTARPIGRSCQLLGPVSESEACLDSDGRRPLPSIGFIEASEVAAEQTLCWPSVLGRRLDSDRTMVPLLLLFVAASVLPVVCLRVILLATIVLLVLYPVASDHHRGFPHFAEIGDSQRRY